MANKVDGYLEPIICNGDVYNYKMYMLYNGIEPCYLNNFPNTSSFAKKFKSKISCTSDEMFYADHYGLWRKHGDADSMLSAITGLENIDKSLISLVCACKDSDIQADLTIHIREKDYPLVRIDDNKTDINNDMLLELSLELENLKGTEIFSKKRRQH